MQELAKQFRNIMNTQGSETISEMANKVLQEMDADESLSFKESGSSHTQLPSNLQPNQVCKLRFRREDVPLSATVSGVHFYIGKVTYDLGLWLGDGSVDNPEYETRIYNVDSAFVTPA
jgi:hypothetical protein